MATKKRGLGKGLEALLSSARMPNVDVVQQSAFKPQLVSIEGHNIIASPVALVEEAEKTITNQLKYVPIDLLQPGKYQPRRDINAEALEELAESIRARGVIQPIVVRPLANKRYEIVAGERRWRASQLANLDNVPCVVQDLPDDAALAIGLIENIQREDLNPIEEAVALQRLLEEFELTHQQVADAVGKSRTTITNLLRLMSLNADVRILLEHGDLEMGHARALLALSGLQQSEAARNVVARGLSVRQTEALVRQLQEQRMPMVKAVLDPDIRRLQDDLSGRIGAPVLIECSAKGKGKLVIRYSNLDELDGILDHIK